MLMGLEIAALLHKLYPDHFQLEKMIELVGSKEAIDRMGKGEGPARVVMSWADALDAFRKLRAKYLLYP
jgi:uncharacterized protein YbbC (DUF1343 family)